MSTTALAALLLLALETLELKLQLPPGLAKAGIVKLVWYDQEGAPLREEEVRFERPTLTVRPPEGALFVQADGPEHFSEMRGWKELARSALPILPRGTVRVTGLVAGPERPRVFASEWPAPGETPMANRTARVLEVAATAVDRNVEKPSIAFALPSGRYALAVDAGSAFPPSVFRDVEISPGVVQELVGQRPVDRELAIAVRTLSDGKPLAGAAIAVPQSADLPRRVLASALRRRAGKSGADGLIRLSRVAADEPLEVRVTADGYRSAGLRLAARFDDGERSVGARGSDAGAAIAVGRAGRAQPCGRVGGCCGR